MSLRNRIAALVGAVVLIALAAAAGALYPMVRGSLTAQRDQALVSAATGAPALLKALAHRASGSVDLGSTTLYVITDPKNPAPGSGFVPVSDRDRQVLTGRQGPYFAVATLGARRWRYYTARLPGDPDVLVRAAVPAASLDSTLTGLRTMLVVIIVAGTLLCAFAARLLAGRVLRPVTRLTRAVENVASTGDLTVPVRSRGRDEISRLARSFATMMAAVDASVREQRQLVADASHELRTPMTSLTTDLDLLAEDRRLPADQADLVREAGQQAAELSALINDVIELARSDQIPAHLEDVRLDLIAEQVAARAATRAPSLRVETELLPVMSHADPDAVERAVGNLIDNAIKWSPPGGRILVQVSADGCIGVTDQGPGVAAEDLPHIFERFYRSRSARALPGSGLGLAIVAQVARTHGGSVTAIPLNPGVRLQLKLPTTAM